jgi:hypothetical protein
MSTYTHFQRETLGFVEESARSAFKSDPSKFVRRSFIGGLLVCSLLGFTGCGKKKEVQRVAVFPVEGQLLAAGRPLANALLVFHPKSPSAGVSKAHAQTDKDGKFKVSTYTTGDGAVPGEYIVTAQHFSTITTPEGSKLGPSDISEKYSSPQTTDWVIKVAAQPNILPPKTITR